MRKEPDGNNLEAEEGFIWLTTPGYHPSVWGHPGMTLQQLVTAHPQSGAEKKIDAGMRILFLVCFFTHFYHEGSSPQNSATHIQGGFSNLKLV